MLQGTALRRADCISGLGLAVLGGMVLAQASRMPMGGTYGGVDNPWYASPAAFPLLIGTLLVITGLMIFAKGARSHALRGMVPALQGALRRLLVPPGRQGFITATLLGGYFILIQLHWLPGHRGENYIASSTIFLGAFAIWFYRPHGQFPHRRMIITIMLVSTLIAWAVATLFSGPLRVPLP